MKPKEDIRFFGLVREAVHKDWNPIGICAYAEEFGEYDGYLPNLIKLLKEGGTEEDVFSFLWEVETESMGLSESEQATKKFAEWLVSLTQDS